MSTYLHLDEIILTIILLLTISAMVIPLARMLDIGYARLVPPRARRRVGFVVLGALLAAGVTTPIQFASGVMVIALTLIATPWLDQNRDHVQLSPRSESETIPASPI